MQASQGLAAANPAMPRKSRVTPMVFIMEEMLPWKRRGVKYWSKEEVLDGLVASLQWLE